MPLDPSLQEFSTSSPAIASYSYVDITNGTGVEVFYISKFNNSTGVEYKLVTKALESSFASGRANITAATDCDLTPFNTPRTITGTAVLSCFGYCSSGTWTVTARFYKVSGAVETAISASTSSGAEATSASTLIYIPLTLTDFAEGDFLRVKITPTGANAAVGTNTLGPAGLPNLDPCPFILNIPFKLEL